jgi:hypothetical protein
MIENAITEPCIRYIADRRFPDGGYCFYRLNEPNVADTFFALDTLRTLGAGTDDPATARWLRTRQYLYAHLCRGLGIAVPPPVRSGLLAAVRASHTPDGGYPTLVEAFHAMAIRTTLDAFPGGKEAAAFLQRCTHPEYSYVNVPGTSPAYLEHVAATRLLGISPSPEAGTFILRCLTPSGGFSRSVFGGTATLETTWMAVRTILLVDGQEETR